MHKCDNPACVNPIHLQVGSVLDNIRDMDVKGRRVTKSRVGIEHSSSALKDPEVVRLIRETKRNTKAFCAQFGISKTTVQNIRRGQRYANV